MENKYDTKIRREIKGRKINIVPDLKSVSVVLPEHKASF